MLGEYIREVNRREELRKLKWKTKTRKWATKKRKFYEMNVGQKVERLRKLKGYKKGKGKKVTHWSKEARKLWIDFENQ